MRICIIYDCLYPWTIGGAERWYRSLAERLAAQGHNVTYFTLKQWADDNAPDIPGVRVISTGSRMALYSANNKRRIWPPLRFGMGLLWHLLRHGRDYDRLHMMSFPYFSVLAAGVLQPLGKYRIAVDWFEVWSRSYWRAYLGPLGIVGWTIQKLCARIPQQAHVFSTVHGERLMELGLSQAPLRLAGLYRETKPTPSQPPHSPATVVYAGRLIPEKRVGLLVEALALAMTKNTEFHAIIVGSGPEYDMLNERVGQLGLSDRLDMPGFVDQKALDAALGGATLLIQPSAREGYGLVVIEASARSVPSIVVASEDNAAVELVEDGVNGLVVPAADPQMLADTILHGIAHGAEMRVTTADWYARNAHKLSIESSIATISEAL